MARSRNEEAQKIALYITSDGGEYSYSISDKQPDLFAMLKRFYPTYIFYRSSTPISNNAKFQKSFFWAPLL